MGRTSCIHGRGWGATLPSAPDTQNGWIPRGKRSRLPLHGRPSPPANGHAKSKTNNTGDSHVVTHRSTNPAITCLYMAERTGCLVFTYLWSFVLDLEVTSLCTSPARRPQPPQDRRGASPRAMSHLPGATLPRTTDVHRRTLPRCSRAALRHVPTSGGDPAVDRGHADAEPEALLIHHPSTPFVQYTRLQVRANQISPSTNGEVFNKSSGQRAYAQQLVTTRLLDCLHDPVRRPSRLQGIHPSAL